MITGALSLMVGYIPFRGYPVRLPGIKAVRLLP